MMKNRTWSRLLFVCWVIVLAFVVVCLLFSKLTFSNNILGELSDCQMVWIQVGKEYQQTKKVTVGKKRLIHITHRLLKHNHKNEVNRVFKKQRLDKNFNLARGE